MTIEVTLVKPIEGYDGVAEYRYPRQGDVYINRYGDVVEACSDHTGCFALVLRKQKQYRNAEPSDITFPFKTARFRDHKSQEWTCGELIGYSYRGTKRVWYGSHNVGFAYWECQLECV
jgi:hypothetical protein